MKGQPTAAESQKGTPARPLTKTLIRAGSGALLALILFEILIRQFYFVPWAIDKDFGTIVLPGATIRYRREGNGKSHWTVHGIRRNRPVPPETRPILVLGDSFTEAYMLNDGEVFTDRLETLLRNDGYSVPVVNLGKAGASAADYIGFAERNRRFFKPRWTIIQLRDSDLTDDAWASGKPRLVWNGDEIQAKVTEQAGEWGLLHRAVWWLRQRSGLVNFAIIRVFEFGKAMENEPPLFNATARKGPPHASADGRPFPVSRTLDALVKAYASRVTILYLPDFDASKPGAKSAVEKMVEEHCRKKRISYVSLRTRYAAFARHRISPFGFANTGYNIGHLNATGHRVAAVLLRDELERLIRHAIL